VLVVAGDVTVEQVRTLAETYYGVIPAQPVPPRARVEEPPRVATARLEFRSPRVAQARWTRSFLAPSYSGGETKYAYALQVLAEIVGGGATSRLNRTLVVAQKLALSAGAFYDASALDLTTFGSMRARAATSRGAARGGDRGRDRQAAQGRQSAHRRSSAPRPACRPRRSMHATA